MTPCNIAVAPKRLRDVKFPILASTLKALVHGGLALVEEAAGLARIHIPYHHTLPQTLSLLAWEGQKALTSVQGTPPGYAAELVAGRVMEAAGVSDVLVTIRRLEGPELARRFEEAIRGALTKYLVGFLQATPGDPEMIGLEALRPFAQRYADRALYDGIVTRFYLKLSIRHARLDGMITLDEDPDE